MAGASTRRLVSVDTMRCSLRGHYPTGSKGQRRDRGRRYLSRLSRQHPWVSLLTGDRSSFPIVGARFRLLFSCCAILGAVLVMAVPASARTFRPRIGHALGIVPRAIGPGSKPSTAPLVYHGGAVMHHVTVHTIYWAPPGFRFDPAPPGSGDYVSVTNGCLRDATAGSGTP